MDSAYVFIILFVMNNGSHLQVLSSASKFAVEIKRRFKGNLVLKWILGCGRERKARYCILKHYVDPFY